MSYCTFFAKKNLCGKKIVMLYCAAYAITDTKLIDPAENKRQILFENQRKLLIWYRSKKLSQCILCSKHTVRKKSSPLEVVK